MVIIFPGIAVAVIDAIKNGSLLGLKEVRTKSVTCKSLWLIIKMYLQISVDFTTDPEKHELWLYCWLSGTTILSCTFLSDLSNISEKEFIRHSSQSSPSMTTLEHSCWVFLKTLFQTYRKITRRSHRILRYLPSPTFPKC